MSTFTCCIINVYIYFSVDFDEGVREKHVPPASLEVSREIEYIEHSTISREPWS